MSQSDSSLPDQTVNKARSRHTACDGCRIRKLKCSGEPTRCERCAKENTLCVYSEKKTMGRPRKRRAITIDNETEPSTPQFDVSGMEIPDLFQSTALPTFEQLAPSPAASTSDWLNMFDDSSIPIWDMSPISPPQSDFPLEAGDLSPNPLQLPTSPPNLYPSTPYSLVPSVTPSPWPCPCIPTLLTTLSTLSTLRSTFPLALPPLRHATTSVRSILRCQSCSPPHIDTPTLLSFQNTLALSTLIPHISTHYSRLLSVIDAEAAKGGTKRLRVGEIGNPALENKHTGAKDCPAGVEVEIQADVWKEMMRGVVEREVRALAELVEEMETRGRRWHESGVKAFNEATGTCAGASGHGEMGQGRLEGTPMCMTVVEMTRLAVQGVGAQVN